MDNLSTKFEIITSVISGVVVLCLCAILYLFLKPRKWSSDEPPLIPSWLPYIGHGISMFWEGGKYFRILRYGVQQNSTFVA